MVPALGCERHCTAKQGAAIQKGATLPIKRLGKLVQGVDQATRGGERAPQERATSVYDLPCTLTNVAGFEWLVVAHEGVYEGIKLGGGRWGGGAEGVKQRIADAPKTLPGCIVVTLAGCGGQGHTVAA